MLSTTDEETQSLIPSVSKEAVKPSNNRLKAVVITAVCALAAVSAIVAYSSETSSAAHTPAAKQSELKSLHKTAPLFSLGARSNEDEEETNSGVTLEDINKADFSKDNMFFGRDKIQLKYKEDERLLTVSGITEAMEEEKKKEHPNIIYVHMDALDHDYKKEEENRHADNRKLLDSKGVAVAAAGATAVAAGATGAAAAGVAAVSVIAGANIAIGVATGGASVAAVAGVAGVAGVVASSAALAMGAASVAALGVIGSAAIAYAANGALTLILHPNVCTYQTYGRSLTFATPSCLPGYSKYGLLGDCLLPCNSGYAADPIFYKTCRQVCPAGYVDMGLTCHYTAPLIGNQQCNDPNYPILFLGKCYARGVNTANLLPLAQLNPCPGNCNDILGFCWTKSNGCSWGWNGCCFRVWGACCGCPTVSCDPPSRIQVNMWDRGYQQCPQGYSNNGAVCTANSIDPTCPSGYTKGLLNVCGLNMPPIPSGFSGLPLDPIKGSYDRSDNNIVATVCPSGQSYLTIANWAVIPGCYSACKPGDMPDPKGAINCIAPCSAGYTDCAQLLGFDLGGILGQRSCGLTKDDCVKVQFTGNQNLLAGFAPCTTLPVIVPFTLSPTATPTLAPTAAPTFVPTAPPTFAPSFLPTRQPSALPTLQPTQGPTPKKSVSPTVNPTFAPTFAPTFIPTQEPSFEPTAAPTFAPTVVPSLAPTVSPTFYPSERPIASPTFFPTPEPTAEPSFQPIANPTVLPTGFPIANPTFKPSLEPTVVPTFVPTEEPTMAMRYQKVSDSMILCLGTWMKGKSTLSMTAGCGLLSVNALEEMNPGDTSYIVHVCSNSATPVKLTQSMLTDLQLIGPDGKSTISDVFPGADFKFQYFSGPNFNGETTVYPTYDGSLVHKVYPSNPVVKANDNVYSVIATSTYSGPLPTSCKVLA